MISCFAEIARVSFRPKTMDYSKAFRSNIFSALITPNRKVLE